MKGKITLITIVLPWWLEWARKFLRLKSEVKSVSSNNIIGRKADVVIVDEAKEFFQPEA